MDKRKEIFTKFLNNEETDRVPVALWHHFVSFRDHHRGLSDPAVMERVKRGQKKYYEVYHPDMVKIMSDGYFGHPAMLKEPITTVEGIKKIEPCGENHPFITEQVDYVKEIVEFVGGEVHTFYNIFSPLNYIRLKFEEYDEDFEKFTRLFFEDKKAMYGAAEKIAEDIVVLVDRVAQETKVDGFYYSVQAVQDARADKTFHDTYVKPLDLMIMREMLKYTDNILIHICGWGEYTNDLTWYVDYPAKVFNWATHNEHVSLGEGKKLFSGKPVMGGFDNNPGTSLYVADKQTLKREVVSILDEAGQKGVAIGADCTITEAFDPARLAWILEAVENYNK